MSCRNIRQCTQKLFNPKFLWCLSWEILLLRTQLLGSRAHMHIYSYKVISSCFPRLLHHFTLTLVYKCSCFSPSSPDFIKVWLIHNILYILITATCSFVPFCPAFLLTPDAAAKSLQSCLTLCHPIDGSPPGSPVPGILQARTLEWVAISFSNAWKWKVKVKSLSCVWLLATSWTAAHQAPPSMGFSRRGYWSRVPLPSPSAHSYPFSKNKLISVNAD